MPLCPNSNFPHLSLGAIALRQRPCAQACIPLLRVAQSSSTHGLVSSIFVVLLVKANTKVLG